MENRLNEHDIRIREIEKTLNQLDIRIRELAFSHQANSNMVSAMLPKVEEIIANDRLAERVKTQLQASENAGWTRRERYMALFVGVATIGNLLLNAAFLVYHH